MCAADAATLLIMHARNYTSGPNAFRDDVPRNKRLNYSPQRRLYVTVGNDGFLRGDDNNIVIVPSSGGSAIFHDVPKLPSCGRARQRASIDVLENGVQVPTIGVLRRTAPMAIRVLHARSARRNGANLRHRARRRRGELRMSLDGGIDINSQIPLGPTTGEKRDKPPGTDTDTFLGYEQMQLVRRVAEKFAALTPARNVIGSPGAETWRATIGTGFDAGSPNQGNGPNTNTSTAAYAFHDPAANRDGASSAPQFTPQPGAASGQAITVRVKTAYQFQVNQTWLYYTTDGSAPEGSAGVPAGTTQAVSMAFESAGADDPPALHTDWWVGTIPAQPAGTVLRYKIGTLLTTAASRFPNTAADVDIKKRMETIFQITNFNATTCTVFPHNDLGERRTGLSEGFHSLSTRAFLSRSGKASLFKTTTQTFYYDMQRTTGQVSFPTENATIGGSTYGFVVLTDASVTGVQFNILDSNAGNDSAANGNGAGNWAAAAEVTPTQLGATGFAREWRFDFTNIPTSGAAIMRPRLREALLRELLARRHDRLVHHARRNVNTGYQSTTASSSPPMAPWSIRTSWPKSISTRASAVSLAIVRRADGRRIPITSMARSSRAAFTFIAIEPRTTARFRSTSNSTPAIPAISTNFIPGGAATSR